jgi:hypothetical protein
LSSCTPGLKLGDDNHASVAFNTETDLEAHSKETGDVVDAVIKKRMYTQLLMIESPQASPHHVVYRLGNLGPFSVATIILCEKSEHSFARKRLNTDGKEVENKLRIA